MISGCGSGSSKSAPHPANGASPPSTGASNTTVPPVLPVPTQQFMAGPQAQFTNNPPPWSRPADAAPNIAAAGLQVAGAESLQVHYHAHLDVIINGNPVTVPAGIGFLVQGNQIKGLTYLHTHDPTGVIHVESPTPTPYTLGQFFTEWGVRLGANQIGGFTNTGGNALKVFVNGQPFNSDPATIVLSPHLEIALWYGPANAKPSVPAGYNFPAGE